MQNSIISIVSFATVAFVLAHTATFLYAEGSAQYTDIMEVIYIATDTATSAEAPTPSPLPAKMPATIQWGVFTGDQSNASMAQFERKTGKEPDMEMVFVHWGNESEFPPYYERRVRDKGRTMVIFWEAMDYDRDPLDQPEYSFDAVLRGDLDSYFADFAAGAKEYGGPVILIPYSEMNGSWCPWGGTVGTNSPLKFIASYRHIHSFFANTPNVKFGWAPNNGSMPNTAENQMELYYPGDDVVDYVGVVGFNFGDPWKSFEQVFHNSLTRLAVYDKPIYIFSVASAEGPLKAAWIEDAFTTQIKKYPLVEGWVWFNENKERDWRVWSDEASLAAFKSVLP